MWVAPFGNHRINGYLRLPDAYRSLSRPSSPLRAKASAMRPYLLLSRLVTPLTESHQASCFIFLFLLVAQHVKDRINNYINCSHKTRQPVRAVL